MFGLLEKGGGEKRWDLDCGSVVRRGEGVLVQWDWVSSSLDTQTI